MSRAKKKQTQVRAGHIRRLVTMGVLFFGFTWGVTWFYVSGADQRLAHWVDDRLLDVTSDMGFQVQNVLVEGIVNVDPDTLKAVLNVENGDPLFAFDPVATKEVVERIAWVDSARVERRFPDTIYVHITERKPLALWQKDQKIRLIDWRGDVIETRPSEKFKGLLLVKGDQAPSHTAEFIEMLQGYPDIWGRAKSGAWIGDRRWDLALSSGLEIRLPEIDAGAALDRLAQAQARDALLDKKLQVIDMREVGRIVVRTAPGDVSEYTKGSAI